jgi:hypothetical protein
MGQASSSSTSADGASNNHEHSGSSHSRKHSTEAVHSELLESFTHDELIQVPASLSISTNVHSLEGHSSGPFVPPRFQGPVVELFAEPGCVFCAAQLAEVHRSFAADGITVDATAFAALFGLEELPWFGPRLARVFALAQTHEATANALHLAPEQFAQVYYKSKHCSFVWLSLQLKPALVTVYKPACTEAR